MFNDYMWQTYLNAGGKNVVAMFEENLANAFAESHADCIMDLQKAYCPSESVIHYINRELLDLSHDLNDGPWRIHDKNSAGVSLCFPAGG